MTKPVRHRKGSSSTNSRQSQDRASGSLQSRNSCTPGRDINEYGGFRINEKKCKKDDLNLQDIM